MVYYTVEDNFGGTDPNTIQLAEEIKSYISNNPGNISPTFYGITTYINETDISLAPFIAIGKHIILFEFSGALSAPEKIFLDGIVAAHVASEYVPTIFTNSKEIIFKTDTVKNNTYTRVTKPFIFPGIKYAKASFIGYMNTGATSYDIKILDKDNNNILSETNLNNTVCNTQDLGYLSNLSSEPWIIEVFVRRNGGTNKNKIYTESINIEYI